MTTAPDPDTERPKLVISATQITTGVVASTTSALLGSTLGVAGTLLGAALGAVAYSVAATLYGHSVAAAKHRIRLARVAQTGLGSSPSDVIYDATAGDLAPVSIGGATPVLADAHRGSRPGALATDPDGAGWATFDESPTLPGVVLPVAPLPGTPIPEAPSPGETMVPGSTATIRNPAEPPLPRTPRIPRKPAPQWRSVLAGALGSTLAFALALLLVTGIESAKGAPLSGGKAGGLSVLGGSAPVRPDSAKAPATGTTTDSPATVTETSVSTSVATETSVVTAPPSADQQGTGQTPNPSAQPTSQPLAPQTTAPPTTAPSTGAPSTENPPATSPPVPEPGTPSAGAKPTATGRSADGTGSLVGPQNAVQDGASARTSS